MKLKYYLRGLGIGMIVTAVIMGVSVGGKTEPMTDAQVMERAKELGMVDGVLSQLPEQTEAPEQIEAPQETEAPEASEVPQEAEVPEQAEVPQEAEVPEQTEAPQEPENQKTEAEQPTVESSYIVTVYPGEGSYTVSRKLAALGLVESADIYDEYLCQNGYDKKICTGNHEIKAGMTAEQIAKALTTR